MREKFPTFSRKLDESKHNKSHFALLGAEKMNISYFELKECGTESGAMATKSQHFCLSLVTYETEFRFRFAGADSHSDSHSFNYILDTLLWK